MIRFTCNLLAVLFVTTALITLPACSESKPETPDDAPTTPAVTPEENGAGMEDTMKDMGDKANEMVDEGKAAVGDAIDATTQAAEDVADEAKDMADEAGEAIDEAVEDTKEAMDEAADDAAEMMDDAKEGAKEMMDDAKEGASDAMKSMEGAMKTTEETVESAMTAVAYDGSVYADAPTAKDFTLTSVMGKDVKLSDYKGKFVVLEWVNHGCPFVKKHYDSGNIPKLQKTYTEKGVVWLSICSSAEGKQGYQTAADWKPLLEQKKSAATATLLDPTGTVGKLYAAKTTPHIYIIDPEQKLIYQGAIDSIPSGDPADISKAVNYISTTLDLLMNNETVETRVTQPYGCGVKY